LEDDLAKARIHVIFKKGLLHILYIYCKKAFYSLYIDWSDPTHISPAHIRGARYVVETIRSRSFSLRQ